MYMTIKWSIFILFSAVSKQYAALLFASERPVKTFDFLNPPHSFTQDSTVSSLCFKINGHIASHIFLISGVMHVTSCSCVCVYVCVCMCVGYRYYRSVCSLALDRRLFQVNPPFKKLWRFSDEPTNPRWPQIWPIGRSEPIGFSSDLAAANRNSPLYSVFSWAEGHRHAHLGRARDAVVLYFSLLIHTEYLRIEEPGLPLVSLFRKQKICVNIFDTDSCVSIFLITMTFSEDFLC